MVIFEEQSLCSESCQNPSSSICNSFFLIIILDEDECALHRESIR